MERSPRFSPLVNRAEMSRDFIDDQRLTSRGGDARLIDAPCRSRQASEYGHNTRSGLHWMISICEIFPKAGSTDDDLATALWEATRSGMSSH